MKYLLNTFNNRMSPFCVADAVLDARDTTEN